ncbi:MAG: DUF427 domain-containing protein [Planctomycetota bacterium]
MKTKRERESVWDYPRPPIWEPCERVIHVVFAGRTIAATTRSIRVLETSHPPVYYIPPCDIEPGVLRPAEHRSFCEWKGVARYHNVSTGGNIARNGAWSYPDPAEEFEAIRDWVAFYAHRMEACYVDGELVQPQSGSFYGGWITSDLEGPFKGGPGTRGW